MNLSQQNPNECFTWVIQLKRMLFVVVIFTISVYFTTHSYGVKSAEKLHYIHYSLINTYSEMFATSDKSVIYTKVLHYAFMFFYLENAGVTQ